LLGRLVAGASLAFACLAGQAQPYPSKPIRLVVPFPAAGTAAITARPVAQALAQGLGQQIVVDNRGGDRIAFELQPSTPEEMSALLAEQLQVWRRAVQDLGIDRN
jgi:Uncharacterized protein conserved in bacteria